MTRFFPVILAAACIAPVPTALAAPCAGFTDVDDANALCPDVDWLKNRAITLGCTSATQYCPNDAVSRLSMAAFLNRLGTALTPEVLYHDASGGALDLDSPPQTVCATSVLPAAAYPRSAHAVSALSAQVAVAATAGLRIVQSIDGGTTWTPLNAIPGSAGGSNRWVNATVYKGEIPLVPGTSYQLGLRVERGAGPGTGDLVAWNCQLEVLVTTRTGTASPY